MVSNKRCKRRNTGSDTGRMIQGEEGQPREEPGLVGVGKGKCERKNIGVDIGVGKVDRLLGLSKERKERAGWKHETVLPWPIPWDVGVRKRKEKNILQYLRGHTRVNVEVNRDGLAVLSGHEKLSHCHGLFEKSGMSSFSERRPNCTLGAKRRKEVMGDALGILIIKCVVRNGRRRRGEIEP